jgi:hypothetical protein
VNDADNEVGGGRRLLAWPIINQDLMRRATGTQHADHLSHPTSWTVAMALAAMPFVQPRKKSPAKSSLRSIEFPPHADLAHPPRFFQTVGTESRSRPFELVNGPALMAPGSGGLARHASVVHGLGGR